MVRSLALLLILAAFASCRAQENAVLEDSITRAIDDQVWRPFVKAFNAHDIDDYLAVHAKNVVRWPLGWGSAQVGDSMRVNTRRGWNEPSALHEDRTIELNFTHRSHTHAFAYDIGYYQVNVRSKEGIPRAFIGHFTTILGKEGGRWKIFLDADNGDGVTSDDLKKGVRMVP
jgi:ketosteroid isomerase-like protein